MPRILRIPWGVALGVWVTTQNPAASSAALHDLAGTVLVGERPEADAVVWLEAPRAARLPRMAAIDQRDLTFSPNVLAVSVGTTVRFPNSDRVLHNVFSFKDGRRFDLGLYPVGHTREVTVEQAGVSRVFCNIHPGMGAYIVAVDSPYFAVSDRSGTFLMSDVPSGTYTFHAWRQSGPALAGTITVAAGARLEVKWSHK